VELIFDQKLTNSGPANQLITQIKQEEFQRNRLASMNGTIKELLSITVTNVHYWGEIELVQNKDKEPIN